jgi:hypothetical protein
MSNGALPRTLQVGNLRPYRSADNCQSGIKDKDKSGGPQASDCLGAWKNQNLTWGNIQ